MIIYIIIYSLFTIVISYREDLAAKDAETKPVLERPASRQQQQQQPKVNNISTYNEPVTTYNNPMNVSISTPVKQEEDYDDLL